MAALALPFYVVLLVKGGAGWRLYHHFFMWTPAVAALCASWIVRRKIAGFGFGLGQPNLKVDNRDVIIDYPCDKHEGAPMTFILSLAGRVPYSGFEARWTKR